MMKGKYLLITLIFLIQSCSKQNKLFVLLKSEKTGVEFNNKITETDDFNILTDEYIFNGGGVALADFNRDGLPDLFFTGNMVSNELYLNKGYLKFENVTDSAKLNSTGFWSTGAAVVDINSDGWMDIYVSGAMNTNNRKNRLYVNQGLNKENIPVFEEQAEKFGIDDNGNTMGACFIDYDKDGDLDLYVLNNEQNETIPTNYRKKIIDGSAPSNDKFYKNNGDGTFSDITLDAGILFEGFGLSVTPVDINKDQWIDLYITNDYLTNDLLYVNQKNGTFKNEIQDYLSHQSKFSMGSDASDFNNDGYTDLISLDMLGESHERRKTTISKSFFFQNVLNKKWDYQDQHMRNMLFKNNGPNLPFSEIGQFSGVYQTDWSWSPLFADFDYDGNRDLFITNGFPRDITDMDFANYRLSYGAYTPVSTLLDSIPIVKIPNYAYKNNGDLTFEDVSKKWGLGISSFSNGAVFSDLDLDGDIDYVVNNINDKAFIFENILSQQENPPNYLQIELEGDKLNPDALGAKVVLRLSDNSIQFQEQQISRGYMSSADPVMYFGLGKLKNVVSVEILWPNGLLSKINNPDINKRLTFSQSKALAVNSLIFPFVEEQKLLPYKEVSSKYNINYLHNEKNVQDFFKQRLLPHKLSQNGPCIAVGDINSDGNEDFIVGSSSSFSPRVFIQSDDSKFASRDLFQKEQEKKYEVESMTLFDADQDGDLDLYLVSGGNEYDIGSKWYQDRLLINDGFGNFKNQENRLPKMHVNGCIVRPADFDNDGDLDLFVGGHNKPGAYPLADNNFLLRNNNGFFEDVTDTTIPSLDSFGILTDALWTDINGDKRNDIILVGEYSPVTILLNKEKGFEKLESETLEDTQGLWRAIEQVDIDQDGDLDYILGNLGKNNMLSLSPETPMYISTKDVDKNGSVDPLIFNSQQNSKGELDIYPIQFWDNLTQQSPMFRQEFNSYHSFSKANFEYYKEKGFIDNDSILIAKHSESKWIENLGEGNYKLNSLPDLLQLGPINDFLIFGAGNKRKVFVVGNDFGGAPFEGNTDALQGTILYLDENEDEKVVSAQDSGFNVFGDAREIKSVRLKNGKILILVAQNQNKLLAFEEF